MNGFLLQVTAGKESTLAKPVPEGIYSQPDTLKIFPGICLHTWGNDSGDIHFSLNKNKSILILSGYISEMHGLSNYSNQQDVCDKLRAHLDNNNICDDLTELLPSLYGSFAIAYVRFQENTIYTITDRISSRLLWEHSGDSGFYLSTHAVSIARSIPKPEYDPAGLGGYLLYSAPIDLSRGLFSEIYCQQEGVIFKRDLNGKCLQKIDWYQFKHRPDNKIDLRSWIEMTSNTFIRAAERVLKTSSKPLIFLSGGVDSRITSAAITAAGGKPVFCTLADSVNIETRVASAVGKLFGFPHEIVMRNEEWYLNQISNSMFQSHGVYTWTHSHFAQAYEKLEQSSGVDSALLGDYCEAFSKAFCSVDEAHHSVLWKEQEFYDLFDELPLPNYRPVNKKSTMGLLQRDFHGEIKQQMENLIKARYQKISNVSEDPTIVGDHFFRWQKASALATFQMFNDLRSAGPEKNLMFDNDLHQLLEIMPASVRFENNLGSKILRHLSPRASFIPNSNTLLPLLFPAFFHKIAQNTKPVLGKIKRKFVSNTYKTTGSWQHLPLLYSKNQNWKKSIEAHLFDSRNFLPPHLFSYPAIEKCWQNYCAGDLALHSDIEKLFGLSVLGSLIERS